MSMPQHVHVPPGPDISHPGYVSDRTYSTFDGAIANLAVGAADLIYFYPFRIPRRVTIIGGNAYVVTGGAGSAMKAALYANSPISSRPVGAPLVRDNTGVATATSATRVSLAFGVYTLRPGFYWAGAKWQATLPTMQTIGTAWQGLNYYMGAPTANGLNIAMYTFADAYANAMPVLAEGAAFAASGASGAVIGLTT